jgi:hypothetical protein
MRTIAGMGAYILQIAYWVTLVLGGLALALTVSGLFSVLSYLRYAARNFSIQNTVRRDSM